MIRKKLSSILKEYFVNFTEEKFDFKLLKGKIELRNLYFNVDKINDDLGTLPFKVKFGLLTKLTIDITIIGLKLELLDIEDLVIIVGPDPSQAMAETRQLNPEEVEQCLVTLLNNFDNLENGKKLEKNPTISKEEKKDIDLKKKEDMNAEPDKNPLNVMGPELNELLLSRLKFKIRFHNIKILYEDDKTLQKLGPRNAPSFYINFHLKDFIFKSVKLIYNI